jgi:hypothetical protein
MREGALEILPLLLLGFIAMLAIVPPIIRGKLEDSPLVTTQSFRKSMQEIAHSLEPRLEPTLRSPDPRTASTRSGGAIRYQEATVKAGAQVGSGSGIQEPSRTCLSPAEVRNARRRSTRRAEVRRNRVLASLTLSVILWGLATLCTGNIWCLAMFAFCGFLLAFFWGLTLLVPYIYMRGEARKESSSRHVARKRHIA